MHAGKVLIALSTEAIALVTRKILQVENQFSLPIFDASSAWQMGHNSREGVFLVQELLLDFPAWLDLTSNANNTITVYHSVKTIIIHSKYFPVSDWLKPHA